MRWYNRLGRYGVRHAPDIAFIRHRFFLAIAIGLGISIGLLPVGAAWYLSRERAVATERSHLRDYAEWTLERANLAITRAQDGLRRLMQEQHVLCSPEHLQRLRQMTTDILSVERIETFRDGKLACDSWGPAGTPTPRREPDVELADGFGIIVGSEPNPYIPAGDMLQIAYGPYLAHIKRERLVDVLHDTPMVLGLATKAGRLVAITGTADPDLVNLLTASETSGTNDQKVFASLRGGEFIAFAISDHSTVNWRTDSELWKLIPIGLLISAIIIGLIVWISRQRTSLAAEVRSGVRYREFVAWYQPIMEIATGRCVGAEALIRWQKPDGSWVRPDLFIPFAEQHHLIEPITDIMIEQVLADMADALRADPSLHVAVNVSSGDIQSGRFLDTLTPAVRAARVNPAQVWVEVTERGFMEADAARATLERVHKLGHRIAIDDFGTGFSSLSLLGSLPLDVLKIDKSFVDAIGRDAATSIVTPAIIEMAHSLKLVIVAEGVETAQQATYLRAAGVELGQGWLYAKALPPKEFLAFHARWRNTAEPIPPL